MTWSLIPGVSSADQGSRAIRFAKRLKEQAHLLILLWRHSKTPRLAKFILTCALGYVFSPVQIIPSFIPVIGWIDDAAVILLALWLVKKLVPAAIINECQKQLRYGRPVQDRKDQNAAA